MHAGAGEGAELTAYAVRATSTIRATPFSAGGAAGTRRAAVRAPSTGICLLQRRYAASRLFFSGAALCAPLPPLLHCAALNRSTSVAGGYSPSLPAAGRHCRARQPAHSACRSLTYHLAGTVTAAVSTSLPCSRLVAWLLRSGMLSIFIGDT